jgi:hypothetical protein
MTIKISNNTKLDFEVIGQIIDKYMNDGKENTFYFGKVDMFKFRAEGKVYLCSVRYLKNYINYIIEEYKNEKN